VDIGGKPQTISVREASWTAVAAATAFLSIHRNRSDQHYGKQHRRLPPLLAIPVLGTGGKQWLLPPHSKAAFAAPWYVWR
jgi:hypothetical protein